MYLHTSTERRFLAGAWLTLAMLGIGGCSTTKDELLQLLKPLGWVGRWMRRQGGE
ncbi:hypothetical protein [Azotobacter vinelandii]|uniref:hypothetical protein n=1 Tax=Azotobacter vinelandii TaxID=354 RepID=UPI00092486B9|nr:hypothetical protein [Azotobacter vinelandii]WKN23145.1 hypothetical protein AVAEIV_001179 [Azotobacter vinelandii]SFY33944.1 hypothetical protein SAMN04244547_05186 [Azotobacter vinelandii]